MAAHKRKIAFFIPSLLQIKIVLPAFIRRYDPVAGWFFVLWDILFYCRGIWGICQAKLFYMPFGPRGASKQNLAEKMHQN
jgi:hypothetical protein